MSQFRWIDKRLLITLHDESLASDGGASGIRDEGLLDSALNRAVNLAMYGNPDYAELTAAYGVGLAKNHAFVDGNKRVAGAMFLWFLEQNRWLYHSDGSKRIADNALTALCLMVAQSDPKEKDLIVKVIINLINKDN